MYAIFSSFGGQCVAQPAPVTVRQVCSPTPARHTSLSIEQIGLRPSASGFFDCWLDGLELVTWRAHCRDSVGGFESFRQFL